MVKEQNRALKRFFLIIDLSVIAISFFMGYFLRAESEIVYNLIANFYDADYQNILPINIYVELLPALLILWTFLLYKFGMYKSTGIRKFKDAFIISLKAAAVGFVLFGSYVFILHKQEEATRLLIGIAFLIAVFGITVEKALFLYIFKIIRKRGTSFKGSLFAFRSILIVGTGERVFNFIKLVDDNPDWGLTIIGLVDYDKNRLGKKIGRHEVLGTFEDVSQIIRSNVVDEVVFIVPRQWLNKIEELVYICENEGLTVNIAIDLFNLNYSTLTQTNLKGFPLLTFKSTSHEVENLLVKRIFDFIVSGIAIVLSTPLFIFLAILVKTTSKGPAFFKQERCSLYSRRFILYKFRTMVVDAEEKLEEIREYNEMNGPIFKMSDDPRVTKVGVWLRKYSLDELPQLWNVLKGDMSLVGPRPPLPSEVDKYDYGQRRKLSMRPGITCLWQIHGRSNIADFTEWMKLDLEYIDKWTIWLDCKILLKTIPVVLTGRGAK